MVSPGLQHGSSMAVLGSGGPDRGTRDFGEAQGRAGGVVRVPVRNQDELHGSGSRPAPEGECSSSGPGINHHPYRPVARLDETM